MSTQSATEIAGSKGGQAGTASEADRSGGFALASAWADPRTGDAAIERIEHTVQPTEAQRRAFDKLRIALQAAAERVAAACTMDTPAGPGARLEVMWRRLRALRQAVIIVRAPLRNFYDLLNDEQKARLDTPRRERPCPPPRAPQQAL